MTSIRVALCNRLLKKMPPLPPTSFRHRLTSLPFCTDCRALFDSWCKKHNRNYSCDEEKEYSFNVFQKAWQEVNKSKDANPKPSSTSGLNDFSEVTGDELLKTRSDAKAAGMGVLLPFNSIAFHKKLVSSEPNLTIYLGGGRRTPFHFRKDWRNTAAITPIKTQLTDGR